MEDNISDKISFCKDLLYDEINVNSDYDLDISLSDDDIVRAGISILESMLLAIPIDESTKNELILDGVSVDDINRQNKEAESIKKDFNFIIGNSERTATYLLKQSLSTLKGVNDV